MDYDQRALSYLAHGDYANAVPLLAQRLRAPDVVGGNLWMDQLRHWRPGDVLEDVIVVLTEGLGDRIMMLRFLPLVRQRSRRFGICWPGPLSPFIDEIARPDYYVRNSEDLNRFVTLNTIYLQMYDLLHFADCHSPATIPAAPYLRPPTPAPGGVPGQNPVLVCWRGNPKNPADAIRSLDKPTAMNALSILHNAGFTPYGISGPEHPPWGQTLPPMTLPQIAAMLLQVGRLVSVDTAMAHLAGAIGVPTILLSRVPADWRWHANQSRYWYPSVTVLLQATPGDWNSVLFRFGEIITRGD